MFLRLSTSAILWLWLSASFVNAQQTVSLQASLTDLPGDPVANGSYDVTFKLYSVAENGSPLWTENQSVTTENGVFNVMLGSVTPFNGIDFSQALWLGLTIDPDTEEMSDRVPLGGVPSAMSLALPYSGSVESPNTTLEIGNSGTGSAAAFQITNPSSSASALVVENEGLGWGIESRDTVLVQTQDIGLDYDHRRWEDIIVEAADATIGLYSTDNGGYGSGLQLGEVVSGGTLTDKWSMVRTTSQMSGEDESALVFSYGPSSRYVVNPTIVQLTKMGDLLVPDGFIRADSIAYNTPNTGYASVHGSAFAPSEVTGQASWFANDEGFYYYNALHNSARAPIQLPHGATVVSMTCRIYDSHTEDLSCKLCESDDGSCMLIVETVSSGNAGTYTSYVNNPAGTVVIDNESHSYYVLASTSGDWSGGDVSKLIINSVTVEFTLPGIP